MIHITFSPKLEEKKIKTEAVRIFEKNEELEMRQNEMMLAQQAKENVSRESFVI